MSLPFLPGTSFKDPTKTKYHVSQSLGFKNGYALPSRPRHGVGGEPLQVNQLTEDALDELANTQPTLTYGNSSKAAPVEFVPAHVAFDKKVLRFDAYFKQTVHESLNEHYRIREVRLFYYLEDNSISVVEPFVENSGIPQGKLIKRQRIPRNELGQLWHWKDLNLGIDVIFYGKVFHIFNCDKFTADFMVNEGIELSLPESLPVDPYTLSRHLPTHSYNTPSTYDRLKQFIEMDCHVLRFFCVWDDRDSMFGDMKPYILHYYLVDDTVEIREIHEPNDGRDPYPVLLCRQRLPKDRNCLPSSFPVGVMEVSEHEVKEWLSPKDLGIGKTINIMGRKFLLYDCDVFTKDFYRVNFNIVDFTPIQVKQPPSQSIQQELPPYNGFGSLEDSKQSCLSLVPQPPKKDFIKMLENDGKVLRFAAVMDSPRAEDEHRKFIISYYLSDDTMTIFEPPQRNAGILGGKFLERMRVAKPNSSHDQPSFYKPQDFAIGTTIEVLKHKFTLTDADEYVLKHMEANAELFPIATIQSLQKKHGKLNTT